MREQYVSITDSSKVYLTSGIAPVLSTRVDVYERAGVTALVSNELGQFHTGRKSDACLGRNICSEELVTFLVEKYGLEIGDKLTAWIAAEDAGVVFCARRCFKEAAEYRFDERFRPVCLGYRQRHGEWLYIEDNCVSFTEGLRQGLPNRMELYRLGDALALLSTDDGPYRLENRGRKREAVYDGQLADYCKRYFHRTGRGLRLHAAPIAGGVCFALNEKTLSRITDAAPRRIDLGGQPKCFLTLGKDNTCYISARASKLLGARFDLYEANVCLALRAEPNGEVRTSGYRYSRMVFNKAFIQTLRRRYPSDKKLYLHEYGEFLVLSTAPKMPKQLPAPSAFLFLPIHKRT